MKQSSWHIFHYQAFWLSLLFGIGHIGIHLSLASILCNGFGFAHISGYLGPGLWTSDSLGIVGSIRFLKPFYSFLGLDPFCYGVISSNHIVAGFMGTYISLWHISSRPGPLVYKLLSMGNVEEVLCSSIASVFFTTFINASLMWYGSVWSRIGWGIQSLKEVH